MRKAQSKRSASRYGRVMLGLGASVLLSACASFDRHSERIGKETSLLPESFLEGELKTSTGGGEKQIDASEDLAPETQPGFQKLRSLPQGDTSDFAVAQFESSLSASPSLQAKVDNMPVIDFIHYALGELLGLEYVVDPSARQRAPVTLSSGGLQSPRQWYRMTIQVLGQNGLSVEVNDGVHYLYKEEASKKGAGVTVNIGRNADAVPNVAGEILQVVPLKYGANISLERTLNQLLDVKVTLDTIQNALFLRGERREIVKALSFVGMFDAPANRGRHIGLVKLTYLTSDEFSKQISALMKAEGIPVGSTGSSSEVVVIVPLPNVGRSAVFANSQELLDRVRYWATIIDQPAGGASQQYFVFYPQFARAADIGSSLAELLGGQGASNMTAVTKRADTETTGQAPDRTRARGFNTDSLRMVVVEDSNSLVFYTSGTEYQGLLPLLERLDVLPKQVVLDIVIAEVTLKDEFRFGFEWALQNSEVSLTTLGAFGASSIGGTALAINGSDGELISQMLQTSQLVNVLSNPTMLVKDGVTANINVGSDISVVGSTTFDPINGQRQTTASVYRKTGVDVTVTPTINAKGVVLMEVEKSISNAVPDSTGAGGNPDVFERSIKTEIVAASGQTVLLGGLISEDISVSGSGTPGVSRLPLLGWLFKAERNSGTRTELVMLITARILDDINQWEEIESRFGDGLRYLDLSTE